MTSDDFPILRASARSASRFDEAIRTLDEADHDGAIRNADLVDVKFVLTNVVDDAWRAHVQQPFFYGHWADNPKDLREFSDSLSMMGLYSMKAIAKRVMATTVQHPAVDAMRAFVAEVGPLQVLVSSFTKDRVRMGRAPSTDVSAKPVNPNKVVKTCACCSRAIAVAGDGMAHHGYRRPGDGQQSASCPGIRFKPLERSSEGLAWMIHVESGRLAGLRTMWERRDSVNMLIVPGVRRHDAPVKIDRANPRWAQEHRIWIANLESSLHWTEQRVIGLRADLERWDAKRVSEPYDPPGGRAEALPAEAEPQEEAVEGVRP